MNTKGRLIGIAPCCAHMRVEYKPDGSDKEGWTPRWLCTECKWEFCQVGREELADLRAENEKLKDLLKEELKYHLHKCRSLRRLKGIRGICNCKIDERAQEDLEEALDKAQP